jgi:hypothetical protein
MFSVSALNLYLYQVAKNSKVISYGCSSVRALKSVAMSHVITYREQEISSNFSLCHMNECEEPRNVSEM